MEQSIVSQAAEAYKELWKTLNVKALIKLFFNVDLTPGQERIVRLVAFDEYPRVVIACMTRYGKSYCVSMGLLLWILMHPNKRLAIIAPTREKTSIIRNHMATFITRSEVFMALLDLDRTGPERIRKEVSKVRMTWKNGVEMRTLSAEGQGAALMGFGFDKVVVDEECDINFEVYRAKVTRMLGDSPDSTYVGIGNPWHRDNQMWQHWINPTWKKVHIGYKQALKEGRITETFIQEQSPPNLTPREFQVLYEAEFPEESEDQLIKYAWIQNALRTPPEKVEKPEIRVGADVARSGKDSTVLTYGLRAGNIYIVQEIKETFQEDTMKTVSRIMELYRAKPFQKITIDTNGLGAGVTDRINELRGEGKINTQLCGFMSGESPDNEQDKDRFLNKKAEAYFKLRTIFEEGRIYIPKNHKLIEQLSKMKWTTTSGSDKIKILDPGEAKEDTSEEKSPDFADSLCYFCWDTLKPALVFGRLELPNVEYSTKKKA